MNGLYTVVAVGIVVVIVAPVLFYILAQQSKKAYKHGKRRFYSLSKKYFHQKKQITMEADRWPIYARPILFTEIDHDAQIEFAKAQPGCGIQCRKHGHKRPPYHMIFQKEV